MSHHAAVQVGDFVHVEIGAPIPVFPNTEMSHGTSVRGLMVDYYRAHSDNTITEQPMRSQ